MTTKLFHGNTQNPVKFEVYLMAAVMRGHGFDAEVPDDGTAVTQDWVNSWISTAVSKKFDLFKEGDHIGGAAKRLDTWLRENL